MPFRRNAGNPLLTPADVTPSREDLRVIGVFNAGAIRHGGEMVLLLRVAEAAREREPGFIAVPLYDAQSGAIVMQKLDNRTGRYDDTDPRVIRGGDTQYLTSISHLRVARSTDGVHFAVDEKPFLAAFDASTRYGVEDPRITEIDGEYYITYSAASEQGIVVRLAKTADFVTAIQLGIVFTPDNKDAALFPERIGGMCYALHRPSTSEYAPPNMWLAASPDLLHWGGHRMIAAVRPGMWDETRIGAGAVPIRTDAGWLCIYHGADSANRYALGAMLLDLDDPSRVIARSGEPLLTPDAPYEHQGFFGQVVFTCGAVQDGDTLSVYYGAADSTVCLAMASIAEILRTLRG